VKWTLDSRQNRCVPIVIDRQARVQIGHRMTDVIAPSGNVDARESLRANPNPRLDQ
jgi:hypothetical protein